MASSKLRIAFYTDTFLPARDGVVTSILSLRKELQRRGHEVYIFTSGNSRTKELIGDDSNIFVMRSMKFNRYPQYNLALFPLRSVAKINEINPDIIHAHTPFMMGTWALAIARMNKIPIVSTFHTMFADQAVIREYASSMATERVSRYAWRYAKFFYNRCNATITPSHSIAATLAKKGIKKTYVVANGIDTTRFNPNVDGSAVRKRLKQNREEKIVLYVGRLSREKKIETLIKAISELRNDNIRAVIAGTGPAVSYLHATAKKCGVSDKVTFAGFVPDNMLPRYYAAADVFCLPSTFETQGLVGIEAMATGKPVVGADSLALREIIRNGKNGEKFQPGDAKSCARKIKKAINNVGSYKETTRTVKPYDISNTTEGVLNVYYKVLKDITL